MDFDVMKHRRPVSYLRIQKEKRNGLKLWLNPKHKL